jgi:putative flippase GtrA
MSLSSHRGPTLPQVTQLARFLVVGCLNVAVTFAVFLLCYRWLPLGSLFVAVTGGADGPVALALSRLGVGAIDAAVANVIAYVAGMVNSFVLNKLWTFEAGGHTARQLQRFVALNLVSLIVSTLVMFVAVDALAAPYLPVFVGTVVLTTVFHYLGNKHWTFAEALRTAPAGLARPRS